MTGAISNHEQADLRATHISSAGSTDDILVNLTLEGRIASWNAAAARLFRLDGGALSKASAQKLKLKLERAAGDLSYLLSQAMTPGGRQPSLARLAGTDVLVSISPIFGGDGRAVGACLIARHQPSRQEHQTLLMRELNHRAKNTFAVVQSIARQMFKDSTDPASAGSQFLGRLDALARNHHQLSRDHWRGLHLRDVAIELVAPFTGRAPSCCTFRGPDLALKAQAAVNVGMTFHELATNSAKYGAFSRPGGRVEVSWTAEGDSATGRLRLCWREFGGPTVRQPERRGLGSRMVEQALPRELSARAELCFHRTGVWYLLDAPLASVAA